MKIKSSIIEHFIDVVFMNIATDYHFQTLQERQACIYNCVTIHVKVLTLSVECGKQKLGKSETHCTICQEDNGNSYNEKA